MVGRAAGFHHHQAHRTINEPTLELSAGKAMRLDDAPRTIGNGQLEHRLGKINAHDRQSSGSIHIGLLRVDADTPHHMRSQLSTMMPKNQGESIPSLQLTARVPIHAALPQRPIAH